MRRAIITLATAALVVATASTALAGGFAVTTVESMPDEFDAGATYTIEYTVRAHGKTPVDSGASYLMLRNSKGGKSLKFDAVNHGDGTYSVEVTIPTEGSWEWEVVSEGWGPQPLGNIEVGAAAAAASPNPVIDALKVMLPAATLLAAALTVRAWSRERATAPTAETG
jgi:hypothetical protein